MRMAPSPSAPQLTRPLLLAAGTIASPLRPIRWISEGPPISDNESGPRFSSSRRARLRPAAVAGWSDLSQQSGAAGITGIGDIANIAGIADLGGLDDITI
jgi:hypothetical protein